MMGYRISKKIFMCAVLACALSGCAAKNSYMGVNFNDASVPQVKQSPTPVFFSERIQQLLKEQAGIVAKTQSLNGLALGALARRASAGDKYAQLELGIRFEEGRGVTRDIKKAKKLYTKAASDSGGTIWVYSPPVGNSPGRTIPLNTGPKFTGLAEAKKRLNNVGLVDKSNDFDNEDDVVGYKSKGSNNIKTHEIDNSVISLIKLAGLNAEPSVVDSKIQEIFDLYKNNLPNNTIKYDIVGCDYYDLENGLINSPYIALCKKSDKVYKYSFYPTKKDYDNRYYGTCRNIIDTNPNLKKHIPDELIGAYGLLFLLDSYGVDVRFDGPARCIYYFSILTTSRI